MEIQLSKLTWPRTALFNKKHQSWTSMRRGVSENLLAEVRGVVAEPSARLWVAVGFMLQGVGILNWRHKGLNRRYARVRLFHHFSSVVLCRSIKGLMLVSSLLARFVSLFIDLLRISFQVFGLDWDSGGTNLS